MMKRVMKLFLIFALSFSKKSGENYIYCDNLDRFEAVILKNSLDVIPYIMRKILCVRRPGPKLKLTKKMIENEIKSRNNAVMLSSEENYTAEDSFLHVFFKDANVNQPFYFPGGFVNIKKHFIDFKVRSKEGLHWNHIQLQKFRFKVQKCKFLELS